MLFRHDQLGLAVGRVALPDGRILNHEIIRAGLAWFSIKFSEDEETARLEAEARAARRGLWAKPDPVPPWEFEEPEPKR